MGHFVRSRYKIITADAVLELGLKTRIMGIVNVTPDSFSGDGCYHQDFTKSAVRLALKQYREGAEIIDIGGESTRPAAQRISVEEELKRILPAIKILSRKIAIPISVDTYKAAVARHALDEGAGIINIIYGTRPDKGLLKMIRNYHAALVVMHMRGTPQTMQKKPSYRNCVKEIIAELRNSIEICLEIGIKSDKIIVDPGIGFGKTLEHNLEILNRLREFSCLNQPILLGTSRKSFIGKVLNQDVSRRLTGTAATVAIGIVHGAHIVRVHDVKAIQETVAMADAILNEHVSRDLTALGPLPVASDAVKGRPFGSPLARGLNHGQVLHQSTGMPVASDAVKNNTIIFHY